MTSVREVDTWNNCLNAPLQEDDKEIYDLIQKEKYRQFSGLELIASENFTSLAVMEANGSPLTNKYSEGLPGARYYGGNEFIDQVENVCRKRALQAFRLNPEEWGVNVQSYSGSTANFSALTALIQPHDRLMGLDLPSGGHLTHGWQTSKKKISSSSIYFESMPYQVNPETGLIDYDRLEENSNLFRPKLIICGASAYARDWEYAKLRKIADKHGAYLMADIAHISGLVAGQEANNPFELCDVVTTTTHKTLRGPRAGLIFFRKKDELENRVNNAVFPSCQGGPHNNTIAAVAVALKHAASPEFKQYAKQVRANAKALGEALVNYEYKLVTGGTDNHLILWDLRPLKLTGSKVEKICDMVNITVNKNSIPGDVNMLAPGGVRIGTSALTSRSFREQDFVKVAEYLHRAVQIALSVQEKAGSKMMKDFVMACQDNDDIANLKKEVETFSTSFPMPGFDPSNLTNSTSSE
ncbi:serine hydroxymethyltransferase [Rhizophagus irregularis]|uniref:Serine hydroxymethyltransferase n=3 Tax=Rhizophagus irregularis TaxID=588596 RepID=A0A2I1G4Q8_9GLOM|nr:serine hydroxymethyltransferase [Rhizophagus irregularis DAOM 181602=DAOM 197198]EXX52336.1 glycine hydroxymethyltransferase SHM2 [Rhizophagus irregularis DAOM 197198w]PKC12438.1 serine hydroxymethyltransferase [Rhizophagus irregularis]PKC71508.1 serine hydroxymethyltransferase [Rhizophagus irregularis]PKK70411.1 serine hydroxymethyltransferase [Rhizophagus irregularis]PKY41625.1 serine hydroxymethyltransferase [Rhizophagus irregularis]|eukprot:XP_025177728.1 serine hydroxymethyltransferase [Rhizophagus irregularis DAOM 181602=DAOM 197198]